MLDAGFYPQQPFLLSCLKDLHFPLGEPPEAPLQGKLNLTLASRVYHVT